MMGDGYLILNEIVKRFASRDGKGDVIAVDRVNLVVQRGEFITFLGPSGCGKTTTLRMVAGFETPTSGDLILDDERINERAPNRRDMAMVFQSYALFPHLSLFENVAYGLRLRRLPDKELRRRIAAILDLTGLTGLEQRAPNQLSGGQQQRVALARALVMEPKVLLMDEPLSNLDAKLRDTMRSEIGRIQKTLAITTIYVTHDQAEAMTLADRIVVMNEGRIEQVASPADTYQRPATTFVADFIGRSNFLEGSVTGREGAMLVVEVLGERLSVAEEAAAAPLAEGDAVRLLIRPEAVRVGRSGTFEGTVLRTTYLGAVVEYEVALDGGARLSIMDADPTREAIYDAGERVGIELLGGCLYLLPSDG